MDRHIKPAFGLPYAKAGAQDGKATATCPACGEVLVASTPKGANRRYAMHFETKADLEMVEASKGEVPPTGQWEPDAMTPLSEVFCWQVVRQSMACHPDWDASTHLNYLNNEVYGAEVDQWLFGLRTDEALAQITEWMA